MCGGCEGMCGRCRACTKVVGGALVLLNAFVWPKWGVDALTPGAALTGWLSFIAVLAMLKGVVKFIMPGCPHCKADVAKAPAKKGK